MEYHRQQQGAVTIVRPDGPLTAPDAPALKAELLTVAAGNLGRLVLDLSTMPFIDSLGLEALVEVTEELSESGQVLKLCGANKTLREVLELTELSSFFEHFEDAGSAARSFL